KRYASQERMNEDIGTRILKDLQENVIFVVSALIATMIVLDKYDDIMEPIPGYGIGIFPGGKGFRNVREIGGDAMNGGGKAKNLYKFTSKKGGKANKLKFSEMAEEEITKIVNQYRAKAPIKIPESAKVKAQSKVGFQQISYKWKDATYKYEGRWHTRTPGAPIKQGNTWVIQRTKPGSGAAKPATEFLIGKDEWIEGYKWYDAIAARKAGTATVEQIRILDKGHWKE
ncbi:TPA: hypothetical protein PTV44_000001, partial [Clostridium botulinum]|nr:hypothetical protein [Clostridium botulinum]